MQLYKSTLALVAFFGGVLGLGTEAPHLYYVGSGQVNLASEYPMTIHGKHGLRISDSLTGGFLTDHNGNELAELAHGLENGVIRGSSLHANARSTWVLADNETAYVTFEGVGELGGFDWFYLAVETGSTMYDYLNDMFIIGKDTVQDQVLYIDLWSTTDPATKLGNSANIANPTHDRVEL